MLKPEDKKLWEDVMAGIVRNEIIILIPDTEIYRCYKELSAKRAPP